MIIEHGFIDYCRSPEADEFLLFTGNSYIRQDGALVMGRGAAQQVRDYHVDIDKWFGRAISRQGDEYGVIIHPDRLGVFQVKTHFRDRASLALISHSATTLRTLARSFPDMRFVCNFPGIGNGGLLEEDVMDMLDYEDLPDNVWFHV